MMAGQSEVQSANALLRLATSHNISGEIQVSEVEVEPNAGGTVVKHHQVRPIPAYTYIGLSELFSLIL